MTRILDSLAEISDGYEALFVDLWGCYHNGLAPYEAAVRVLRDYRAAGGVVILLTNAPRPPDRVKVFLDGIGAPEDSYDGIMSSGGACQRAMASGAYGTRFHYVGPDRDRHMLTSIGFTDHAAPEAEAILCTGVEDDKADPAVAYADRVPEWLDRRLTMLCANPDIVVDRGEERLWCAGALATVYEAAGGRVIWFGKPHAPTYDQTFSLLTEVAGRKIPKAAVLAIGDGIRTDVAGGLAYGLDTVFLTGGLAAPEFAPDPDRPDPGRLEAFLAREGIRPPFAMGQLR